MAEGRAEKDYELELSVVIPALELTDHLVRWVSEVACSEPGFAFEILVVLNHEERPLDVVLPSPARVLFCEKPGSYAARNVGISAARGRVIAFTDSDVTPDGAWLREGYTAVETFDFKRLICGEVEPYRTRKNAWSAYDFMFYLRQRHAVLRRGLAATVNLWVPADIVRALGGFNETLLSCADLEFCLRAGDAGYQMAFADHARVKHPAREGMWTLIQKERRVAGGQIGLSRLRNSGMGTLGHARYELKMWRERAEAIRTLPPPSPVWRLQAVNTVVIAARLCERVLVSLGKRPRRF